MSTCLRGLRSCAQVRRVNRDMYGSHIRALASFIVSQHSDKLISKVNTIRSVWFTRKGDGSPPPPPLRLCDWTSSPRAEEEEAFVFMDDLEFSYVLDRNPAFVKRTDPVERGREQRVVAAQDSVAFQSTLLILLDNLEEFLLQADFAAAVQILGSIHAFAHAIPLSFWQNSYVQQMFAGESKITSLVLVFSNADTTENDQDISHSPEDWRKLELPATESPADSGMHATLPP